MPRFAASKGQANQDQGGGNTKQGLPPSIGVRASLARLMSRKAFSNPVAAALARIFDNFDFDFDYGQPELIGSIYDIRVNASRIYIIGKFKLKLKGSSEILRTNIAVFNATGDNELLDWVPLFQTPSPTTITAIEFVANLVMLGVNYDGQNGTETLSLIQGFNNQTGARRGPLMLTFDDNNVTTVFTIKSSPAHIFVGTDNNFYIFNIDGSPNNVTLPILSGNQEPPSVRAILVDTEHNRVYIGGVFKINNESNEPVRNGVAAIRFPLSETGQDPGTLVAQWNPPVKKDTENYIFDILSIPVGNTNHIEIYGGFKNTSSLDLLAMTVSTASGNGGGAPVFSTEIAGEGQITRALNANGVRYLCGNFTTGGVSNIGVRSISIDNGSIVNYFLPDDGAIVFNIANTSDGKIFVGGFGIKPQKLSVTGGTLS